MAPAQETKEPDAAAPARKPQRRNTEMEISFDDAGGGGGGGAGRKPKPKRKSALRKLTSLGSSMTSVFRKSPRARAASAKEPGTPRTPASPGPPPRGAPIRVSEAPSVERP